LSKLSYDNWVGKVKANFILLTVCAPAVGH
jgi:hypothetical protein